MTFDEHKTGSAWPLRRIVLWSLLAAAAVAWQQRNWRDSVRPPPDAYLDFSQEWLSARNFITGRPVYSPQVEAALIHDHFRPSRREDMLPWNGHPPAATLLALPFGLLSYPDAHCAWTILMMVLFLIGLAVAFCPCWLCSLFFFRSWSKQFRGK